MQRNIADLMPLALGENVDYLDLQWYECRQVLKARTVNNETVNILLSRGERLRHGDVIYEDGRRMVIVRVLPCEVVVAKPRINREMAVLAMEIGNLHMDAEIGDAEIVFIQEPRAMEVLSKLSIPWTTECRLFRPTPMNCAPTATANGELRVIRKRPANQGS